MAASAASIIMIVGYVFAILAHYRLILGKNGQGSRNNPEPAEAVILYATCFLAM
jgi:hypothetical protein